MLEPISMSVLDDDRLRNGVGDLGTRADVVEAGSGTSLWAND